MFIAFRYYIGKRCTIVYIFSKVFWKSVAEKIIAVVAQHEAGCKNQQDKLK